MKINSNSLDTSDLLLELEDGTLVITINRPSSLNALNLSVFQQLDSVLDATVKDTTVKCVILTGAGNKSFVAGADITEFKSIPQGFAKEFLSFGNLVMSKIENYHIPVIGAINGFALGGGCELALACHIRMASDASKFGLPEINLGLIPGYGGTQRLPKLIGKGKALEMMLTGEMVDASSAMSIGLVNQVVSQDQLLLKAKEMASKIVSKPTKSLQNIIKAVNASDYSFEAGIDLEGNLFTECTSTNDFEEGVSAFLEKRKPIFKGK